MDAAELHTKLQIMQERGVPLHKLKVRVEVEDPFYDKDCDDDDVYEWSYDGGERRYLIFRGK